MQAVGDGRLLTAGSKRSGSEGSWTMATYVNAIYLPVPLALTQPTPAEVAEILHNPYSVGFDGAFPLLRREAVELTLEQIFVTFAAQVRAASGGCPGSGNSGRGGPVGSRPSVSQPAAPPTMVAHGRKPKRP